MTRNHDTEAAECRERPIPFHAHEVRATLDGRQSQTRRVAKEFVDSQVSDLLLQRFPNQLGCKYGRVGSRLWVREKWKFCDWTEDGYPWIEHAADGAKRLIDVPCIPDEWGERLSKIWADLSSGKEGEPAADKKWRPSIHMPRWASRITLEITGVRVERLNEISEEDAIAEGACSELGAIAYRNGLIKPGGHTPRDEYERIWDSINGKSHPWSSNPYVWVVEFRRLQNILLSDGAKA